MKTFLKTFATDETGAVTVDWVVLSALVVTLLAAGYGMMQSSTTSLATSISTYMSGWTF
jgi:Flp pilus assembly pilin Flp